MTAPTDSPAVSVVTALYLGTKTLHTEAERSGVIRDLLRGEASRAGYILLQRNLLPAYRALEAGLERHRDTPALLIAHAYTRYLGDLSGGQILKRLLANKPGLAPDELSFYDFPGHDLTQLKTDYRTALDRAGAQVKDPQAVIDEGSEAFRLNTDLSWAVHHALTKKTD
jgi:heme oxygenase